MRRRHGKRSGERRRQEPLTPTWRRPHPEKKTRREGSEKLTFDIWVGSLPHLSQGEEKKKRSLQRWEMHLTDFSGPRKEKRYRSLFGVERGGGPSFHATFMQLSIPKNIYIIFHGKRPRGK